MSNAITLRVPEQHPAFAGHFPDAPLLPGVVLLDEMLHSLRAVDADGWVVSSAKFLHPVRPGEILTLDHDVLASGSIRFVIRTSAEPAGALVATGTLVPRRANSETRHGHQAG
jgi:3-hydroxymyristoyl/3-hydroxydecanoyl-(acyl carrier protein) dehydratase